MKLRGESLLIRMALELEARCRWRFRELALEAEGGAVRDLVEMAVACRRNELWLEGLHRQFAGEGPIHSLPLSVLVEEVPSPEGSAAETEKLRRVFYAWAETEAGDPELSGAFRRISQRSFDTSGCVPVSEPA